MLECLKREPNKEWLDQVMDDICRIPGDWQASQPLMQPFLAMKAGLFPLARRPAPST